MDNMLQYLINLSIFVPFIIILIVVSIRFSKSNLEGMGIYKYTKLIERTNLNKDTDVYVLKIGDEGCVILSSPSKMEKIKDLSRAEMLEIEDKKQEIKKIRLGKLNRDEIKLNKLDLNKLGLSKAELKNLQLKKTLLKKLELKNSKFKNLG